MQEINIAENFEEIVELVKNGYSEFFLGNNTAKGQFELHTFKKVKLSNGADKEIRAFFYYPFYEHSLFPEYLNVGSNELIDLMEDADNIYENLRKNLVGIVNYFPETKEAVIKQIYIPKLREDKNNYRIFWEYRNKVKANQ